MFVYLNPFQKWLYDFEIHLFTQRTTEGPMCNYYRRLNHSLMLQKEIKTCIKRKLLNSMKMCIFFLFCLNIIFFSFSTALKKLQKIVTCFPEDKLSYIYPDLWKDGSQNHSVIASSVAEMEAVPEHTLWGPLTPRPAHGGLWCFLHAQ